MQCKCTSVLGRHTMRWNSGQVSTQISRVGPLPWVLFRANRSPHTYSNMNPGQNLLWKPITATIFWILKILNFVYRNVNSNEFIKLKYNTLKTRSSEFNRFEFSSLKLQIWHFQFCHFKIMSWMSFLWSNDRSMDRSRFKSDGRLDFVQSLLLRPVTHFFVFQISAT